MSKKKYPDVNSDNFYQFINEYFSDYKIPKKQKTLKEFCYPKKWEHQLPQKFLSEIISPDTPYQGLLVYHGIGSGKTCAAINIAEQFKNKIKIIIVLPASLKGNFRNELMSPCAGNYYLTNNERKQISKYHPSSVEYKTIINTANERIDNVYTIYSYNKFTKLLQQKQIHLANTLLIIDEIHNMVSASGTYYKILHDSIHNAPKTLRVVLMSATPIFDKPVEIALTMNLLLRDTQMPIGSDFANTFIGVGGSSENPKYTTINMDLFKKYIKGYLSYYRGAPPHVYPEAIIHYVKTKMSHSQYKLYRKIIISDIKAAKTKSDGDISNSFFGIL